MEWDGDSFGRAGVAKNFEKLAGLVKEDAVFLVSAQFGMGKTFFVERWTASLKARGIPVVVFDAWRNDYLEQPLTGFVSALESQLNDGEDSHAQTRKALMDFAKSLTPVAIKAATRVSLRLMTMGILDGDIDTIREVLVSEGVLGAEDMSAEAVAAFGRYRNQIQLHKELSEKFSVFVERYLSQSGQSTLFVLIDELDRCRPEFTFSLLEDIKHFLGAPNVCFFIFCDEEVLEAQAAKIFGSRKIGEQYIEKFCTQRVKLPDVSMEDFCLAYLDQLWKRFEAGVKWRPWDDRSEHLVSLISSVGISIRQAKRLMEYSVLCSNLDSRIASAYLLANALSVIRTCNPGAFNEFLREGYLNGDPIGATLVRSALFNPEIYDAILIMLKARTPLNDLGDSSRVEQIALHELNDIGASTKKNFLNAKRGFAQTMASFGRID